MGRDDLASMAPPDAQFIELGVCAGRFAAKLLSIHTTLKYFGVDAWQARPRDLRLAQKRLRPVCERVTLLKSFFCDALHSAPMADIIYIDGDAATGQEGGATLRQWWEKVKPGGILAGHDYDASWPFTMAAVDIFASEVGEQVQVIPDRPYASWWLRKST